jgi:acetyltransferase-like isoleucine patch superfamily enzyme
MSLKSILVSPIRLALRATAGLRESIRRIYHHAALAAQLHHALPSSVVVLGCVRVYGSGNIHFGKDTLLYSDLHLETQSPASITLGDGVVLSRGVHLVAMAGIQIGDGTMIGEYASLRDANHARIPGIPMRDAGHTSSAIVLGKEVWVGRGVTILGGVTIGDHATIGANAVVTRDVPAGIVVGGVPAVPLHRQPEQASMVESRLLSQEVEALKARL